MGTRAGIKNKRTLLREQRIKAAQAAARLVSVGDDPYLLTDCLTVMEEGMRFFYRMAREARENVEKGGHYVTAANLAQKIAPYRFPQLSTVKIGGDKQNPLLVRDGVTAQEVRDELLADMAATGLIPTPIANLLEDLDGAAPNGRRRKPN